MHMKDFLKKYPPIFNFLRIVYKFIYRNVIKNKSVYFITSSSKPISNMYGFDRGKPLDRHYIENFLENNKRDVRGTCLELLNDEYTKKYGGARVTKNVILDIEKENSKATLISDLRNLSEIKDDTFDCIILTQVLQFIDDVDMAISECHRTLKPGGVMLVTVPSISRIDCSSGEKGDFWRFTTASAHFLFEKKFKKKNVLVNSFGNARIGLYFYAGLAEEDTPKKLFNQNDANFPLIITVKATK